MKQSFRYNSTLTKILKSYYSIKTSLYKIIYFALKYAYEKATILYPQPNISKWPYKIEENYKNLALIN